MLSLRSVVVYYGGSWGEEVIRGSDERGSHCPYDYSVKHVGLIVLSQSDGAVGDDRRPSVVRRGGGSEGEGRASCNPT